MTPSSAAAYAVDRAALVGSLERGRVELPDPDGRLVAFDVSPTTVLEPALAAAHPELRTWAGTAVAGPGTVRIDVTPAGVHASVLGDGPAWYVDPAYRDGDRLSLSYAGASLPAPERGLVEPDLPQDATGEAVPQVAETPGGLVTLRTYRLALLSDPTYAAYVAPGLTGAASDAAVLAAKVTLVNRLDQVYGDDLGIRFVLVDGTDTALNLATTGQAQGANGPCGKSACFPAGMLAAGCQPALLDRNRWVTGQLVGARRYDVGHVLLGVAGGGAAYLGVAGHPTKAGGCTGLAAPSGDAFAVDYVAHELGHQLGATHTFDGTGGACAGNRYGVTAVEPGSGSSVMGYAGVCGADDLQPHADPVFASASRAQIADYVTEAPDAVFEWQSVALSGFDVNESFRLSFAGTRTAVITRGTNYTADGIKAAIAAVAPSGTSVQVRPFFDSDAFDDRGFALYFRSWGTTLFADVPEPVVEPAAGTFTAAVDDIDAGDPAAGSGGVATATTNHAPVATAPADRTIPVRTPFALTGSATDADRDPLTYTWEQTDVSGLGTGTPLTTQPRTGGPLFRVVDGGPTRSFPDLAQVVAGATNAATGTCPTGAGQTGCLAALLPTAAYAPAALHLRLTARDASPQGGGTASDDVVLTLDKSVGPFRVTSQATPATLPGGSSQVVTWTTGTAALAASVRITLSTDGGATYPTVLAAATPNDGSETVTLPDLTAGAARLRVEAVGNYFYDVNHASFALQGSGAPPPLVVEHDAVPTTWPVVYSDPASVAFSATTGQGLGALTATASGLPPGLALSGGAGSWALGGTPTAEPGSYPVHVSVSDGVASEGFDVTVTVTPEDAAVALTSPTTIAGPSVTLTAQVTQAADGSPGALDRATVRFRDGSTTPCPAAPVSTAGVATCTYAAEPGPHPLTLTVGGSYAGSATATFTVTRAPQDAAPDTTITSGPAGWLLSGTGTWGVSATRAVAIDCRLDGAPVPCAAPSLTLRDLAAGTHRLTAAARGDETPAAREFAVPLDDAALTPSGSWKRKATGAAYLGTCSQTRHRGAALSTYVTGARELALLVRTGSGYGALKVYLDGALLATVRTAGPVGSRAVRIGHFAAPRSGTVRIVAAKDKRVRVDGLGVSTAPF
ncbi:hypothetical protein G5V58_19355 [Nocardioides anomalus]|uniref:Ig-like domain repeat protein n=1 Tax=Nocardioides anomalus TaxID=2712223 RepID=A0A6G6WHW4_9ACTN|nr:hypothetical protein G5V58_19355 [Nocardioides anomalus]